MLSAGQPRQRKKTGESCGPQLSPVDFWDDFILIFNKSKIIFKNEPVTLRMVWAERRQIHRQRRSTAFPNVANTSFRKPIRRSSFQICSTGFISGVYGGRKNNLMLSGRRRASDLCQAAPPQHSGQNGSRELLRESPASAFAAGAAASRRIGCAPHDGTFCPAGYALAASSADRASRRALDSWSGQLVGRFPQGMPSAYRWPSRRASPPPAHTPRPAGCTIPWLPRLTCRS